MKTQLIFLFALGVIASVSCASLSYGNQPDITIDEVRMLKTRLDCVLDKGPCDDLGNMAKTILPEVMNTGECSRCDDQMNRRIKRILYIMHKVFPQELREIFQKFRSNIGPAHAGNH